MANHERSSGFQFHPADNVINLSNKHFPKDVYILLSKTLNFVPNIKKFNKKLLDEKINDFYQCIKLKVHCREITKLKEQTEQDILKN